MKLLTNILLLVQRHGPPHPGGGGGHGHGHGHGWGCHCGNCPPTTPFPEWLFIGLALTAVIIGVSYLRHKEKES